MGEALPAKLVKLRSHELKLSIDFLSSFTGELELETGTQRSEMTAEAEVPPEKPVVEAKSHKGKPFTIAVVVIIGLHVGVAVELARVLVHLVLGVDIFQKTGVAPPLGGSLHKNGVWLELLDEFLGALSEHVRLVSRSHKVHILSIEAFGQVHKSSLEAIVSIKP